MEVYCHHLRSKPLYVPVEGTQKYLGERLAMKVDEQPDRCSRNQAAPGSKAATEMKVGEQPDRCSGNQAAPGSKSATERNTDAGLVPAADPCL